ncbi:hypothetical protein FRC07_009185, partial [Ceratobasidium sp. 392]
FWSVTATTHNIFQQVFRVSLAANAVRQCDGTSEELEKRLKDALPTELSDAGSGWEVVWGPVVWKQNLTNPGSHPGNAWFVACNESVPFEDGVTRPAYVVAIAATSATEDGSIGHVVYVDEWASSGISGLKERPTPILNGSQVPKDAALISNGFGQAVFHLVNNTPRDTFRGAGQTLPEFLQSLPSLTSSQLAPKLIFTGYSLGGALSPSLTYTLSTASGFGAFSFEDVLVDPTAGPSPGNATFRSSFISIFPPPTGQLAGYQYWNINIANPFDIVPCGYCMDPAYQPEVLASISTMYGSPAPWGVTKTVKLLEKRAQKLYYPLVTSYFQSPVPKPSTPPKTTWEYFHTALEQHIEAYSLAILGRKTHTGVCKTAKRQILFAAPVLSETAEVEIATEAKYGNEEQAAVVEAADS